MMPADSNLTYKAVPKFSMDKFQMVTSQKRWTETPLYCQFRLNKHCIHNRANGEQCSSISLYGSCIFLMKYVQYLLTIMWSGIKLNIKKFNLILYEVTNGRQK